MAQFTGELVRIHYTTAAGEARSKEGVFVGVAHPPSRANWGTINTVVDSFLDWTGGERLLTIEALGQTTVITP